MAREIHLNFDTQRVVFLEADGISWGFALEAVSTNFLTLRVDDELELHRMPISYEYFTNALNEKRVFNCEHSGQNFLGHISKVLTVDKTNQVLRLKLEFRASTLAI